MAAAGSGNESLQDVETGGDQSKKRKCCECERLKCPEKV